MDELKHKLLLLQNIYSFYLFVINTKTRISNGRRFSFVRKLLVSLGGQVRKQVKDTNEQTVLDIPENFNKFLSGIRIHRQQ